MNEHMIKAIAEKKKKALEIKLHVDPDTHQVQMTHSGQEPQEGSPAEEKGETSLQEQQESDLAPSVKDGPGPGDAQVEVDHLKSVMGPQDHEPPAPSHKVSLREKAKGLMKKKVDAYKK